jgi:superfamily II DNA or RNA helicase
LSEESNLHPAEILRRKRQEERRQKTYAKVAALAKGIFPDSGISSLAFCVDLSQSRESQAVILEVLCLDSSGHVLQPYTDECQYRATAVENTILSLLADVQKGDGLYELDEELALAVMPAISRLELGFYRSGSDDTVLKPLVLDEASPWRLGVRTRVVEAFVQLEMCFKAEDRCVSAKEARLTVPGLVVAESGVACLKTGDSALLAELMRCEEITGDEREALLKRVLEESDIPVVQDQAVSKAYEFEPRLIVWSAKYTYRGKEQLHAELYFKYGDVAVHESDERHRLYDKRGKSSISRDLDGEASCKALLTKLGFRWSDAVKEQVGWKLLPSRLQKVVPGLLQKGWYVCADGKNYQPPRDYDVTISSGKDWFGISASVTYGDESVPFPEILKMWREGKEYILLDDGTFGILPVEWLVNYTVLSQLGRDDDGQIICSASQAAILQALLDKNATVHADAEYYAKLERLTQIEHAAPQAAPESFQGTLRPYQAESLGWMLFLQQQGFGGILALDMGLGKTPTVLALLDGRRTAVNRPSLVVVPRSLIFNWEEESAKFTPELKIMVWSGAGRHDQFDELANHDVILTTYGTLIRDAEKLRDITFDYCILDESQAIKNADTSNAKAVRLVNSEYRLAMTGTPIENSLSELWSQFEFLNPGLLGNAGVFRRFAARREVRAERELKLVAQALKPFVFRRTKEAVAKDLPEKTEGILYCELEAEQKQVYDDLLGYYHQEMADTGDTNTNQALMLSALLRLRQAACHAGLINDTHRHVASAKLQAIMPHLKEVLSEGHKALIFSQFTTMLGFVREQLDRDGITYTYLDGQTRDRKRVVDQFQGDDNCQVFLISLKAGGVGLNLTAASYVYILDPWWNPATESQAIDRAHRIGQRKPVFAYRLIARDTIEEKMLHMQREKRRLADAVIGNGTEFQETKLTRNDMAKLLK